MSVYIFQLYLKSNFTNSKFLEVTFVISKVSEKKFQSWRVKNNLYTFLNTNKPEEKSVENM